MNLRSSPAPSFRQRKQPLTPQTVCAPPLLLHAHLLPPAFAVSAQTPASGPPPETHLATILPNRPLRHRTQPSPLLFSVPPAPPVHVSPRPWRSADSQP